MRMDKFYIEGELVVYYDYAPAEPQTRDYPGSPAEVTVNWFDLLIGGRQIPVSEEIHKAVLAEYHDSIVEACLEHAEDARRIADEKAEEAYWRQQDDRCS
jgi:hypothetical protein